MWLSRFWSESGTLIYMGNIIHKMVLGYPPSAHKNSWVQSCCFWTSKKWANL